MRRHLLDLVILFVAASVISGFVVLAKPDIRNPVLHTYVLIVGGLLMVGLLAATGDRAPRRMRTELDAALAARTGDPRLPPELARLQREVTLATASSYDLHRRLVPQLREIAETRLARTGARLSPETLGRWWELLRPDRAAPSREIAERGIPESQLRELVSDLERM